MTVSLDNRVRRAADALVVLLLVVGFLRIAVAVASGITTGAAQFGPLGPSGVPIGQRLAAFGGAGDGLGAVFGVIAVVLLWSRLSPTASFDEPTYRRWRLLAAATAWLLVLTAMSSALLIAGYSIEFADVGGFDDWGRLVDVIGSIAAYLVLAAGTFFVLRGLIVLARHASFDSDAIAGTATDADDPAVFAVDRHSGDVLAWWDVRRATEEAPVYGIEDNEYEFFFDDGTVVDARLVDGRVTLTRTEVERLDHLLDVLRAYAQRRNIAVDPEEADEPLAYVDPIARASWLEQWPGWLRWIGRLARPAP